MYQKIEIPCFKCDLKSAILPKMVHIHTDFESPRLTYTLDLVFKQLLGTGYILNQKVPDGAAVICYSAKRLEDNALNIPCCSDLLNSSGFAPIQVIVSGNREEMVLFPDLEFQDQGWKFDLFSAIFYLVSRYEEYSGFVPDQYGRFPYRESILYKSGSTDYPLVNNWVKQLRNYLQKQWPALIFREPSFRYISTIDVDSTFRFKEKGALWSISGGFRDLLKWKPGRVLNRIKTLWGLKPDDFDIFDEYEAFHKEYGIEVIYFFLLGDYGQYDKNISHLNPKQAEIIKKLAITNRMGIHPSYGSNHKAGMLEQEIERFTEITMIKPQISRQHFLVHKFPDTYRNLIANGITEDYTMGYTGKTGFRAGIASPFLFFDLDKNETTSLWLYPFCSMDITPLHYEKLNVEKAKLRNLEVLKRVKAVNGTFISLWHNESLSGTTRWRNGWPEVYKQLIMDAHKMSSTVKLP